MKVNETLILLDKNQTLFDFLKALRIDINTIAVEQNGEIIPRSSEPYE